MGLIENFKKNCRTVGKKYAVRHILWDIFGLDEYGEQLDTLFYFLNKYVDIKTLPPAHGNLREVQIGDTWLLKIFHEVCKKNHLTYWLDYGTLLGAYRHGGFIPWDDDMDVAMPRKDYERAVKFLELELKQYGIQAKEELNEPMARIGIGYKHNKTGIWLDIFPVDDMNSSVPAVSAKMEMRKKMIKYRKYYLKKRFKISREEMFSRRDEIMHLSEGDHKIWYHGQEFCIFQSIYDEKDIFPLTKVSFEQMEFWAPNNIEKYLKLTYGDYMKFPRGRVEHHHSELGPLSEWHVKSNTDMFVIHNELKNIIELI